MKLSEKLKEKSKTIYRQVAELTGTTPRYVGMIARGERNPTKGVGLKVKKELEELITN